MEDCLTTANHRAIEAEEAKFIDTERSEFWTGLNYSVINRLLPELATRR